MRIFKKAFFAAEARGGKAPFLAALLSMALCPPAANGGLFPCKRAFQKAPLLNGAGMADSKPLEPQDPPESLSARTAAGEPRRHAAARRAARIAKARNMEARQSQARRQALRRAHAAEAQAAERAEAPPQRSPEAAAETPVAAERSPEAAPRPIASAILHDSYEKAAKSFWIGRKKDVRSFQQAAKSAGEALSQGKDFPEGLIEAGILKTDEIAVFSHTLGGKADIAFHLAAQAVWTSFIIHIPYLLRNPRPEALANMKDILKEISRFEPEKGRLSLYRIKREIERFYSLQEYILARP